MSDKRFGLSKSDMDRIENKVDQLFNSIGYDFSKVPIDVIDVAKRLGFAVAQAKLNTDDDGFIVVDKGKLEILGIKTDRLIGFNYNRTPEWKRFIIAHEIGHYALDYEKDNSNGLYAHRDHRRGHDQAENEVDYFAASLLMPKKVFVNIYNMFKETSSDNNVLVDMLSKYFLVTTKMATRRVEELGL